MSFTVARPGTPFPSTESVSYFSHSPAATTSSTSSRRLSMNWNTHPIHFQIPTRPVLTPPSLLKRTSSTGSSSSFHLSRTPSAGASAARRSSSSSDCASSVSSPMPTTPVSSFNNTILEESDIEEMMLAPPALPTNNEKPQSSYFTASPSPSPKGAEGSPVSKFVHNFEIITSTLSSPAAKRTELAPPSRPKLKRRDTPRPKNDVLAMAPLRDLPTLSPVDENLPKRRFTSMVDGKSWIVVA